MPAMSELSSISNGLVLDVDFRGYSPKDKSVYTNILTNFGSIWTPNGRVFDGIDDYIGCGNNSSLVSPKTIELWFNSRDLTSTSCLAAQRNTFNTDNSWSIFSGVTDYRVRFLTDSTGIGGTADVTNNTNLVENTWYQIICVANSIDIRIYINGILDSTPIAAAYTPFASSSSVKIGAANTTPANFFKGTIGMARIWNRTLMTMEINQLYLEFRKNLKV